MKTLAHIRYRRQISSSKQRNIDFNLTFEEWYQWWLNQGIDKNIPSKLTKNSLCMCRLNDQGSYTLNNIYCDTISNNVKSIKNKYKKSIQTPYGIFDSLTDCAKKLGVVKGTIQTRMTYYPNLYYYL